MRTGRPRTPIGTRGAINTRRNGDRVVAETRIRDLDGRLRQGRASGPTAAAARTRLMERIRERPSLPSSGVLRPTSSFADLADLWLADLELRDLAVNTKENYRTCLRPHVRPAFEHYMLAEVTTGRVEWFLASQAKVSPSQAKQSRTMLNMLFGYGLRHDAIARNPVRGRRSSAGPSRHPRRSHSIRSRRSAGPPRTGEANQGFQAQSRTVRSATSSRFCSAPPCVPGRCSSSAPATSRTCRPE
ncbi:MAG: hypothetical protein M3306_28985 [Actinomycetota bacterium]|nr:hypothetical protein [Actinomycetota bacterium]